MAERTESVVLDFEVDLGASVESINSLTKANKALREERNKLNLDSKEGQKRLAEINATIDTNTGKIKDNVSALEKQKINIGNYKSALDGVHPALGKIGQGLEAGTKGFKAMTLQALAFIATPVGLVVAALGAALYALTAYFKGSEEGQNNLNKIMAVGSAIMEQFMNVVEMVGKVIFDAVSNPKQALIDFGTAVKENIVNRFFGLLELIPNLGKAIGLLFKGEFAEAGQVAFDAVTKVTIGVENASAKIAGLVETTAALVAEGISNGEKLAALTAKITKDERALTEQRAANDLKVAKLREQALGLEGTARKKVIQEAIALEEGLSKKEVELSKTRLALASLEVAANGDTIEALNAEAEAVAAVASAEKLAFDNTLKFKKELKSINEEINKGLAEQNELERANRRSDTSEEVDPGADPLIDAFKTQLDGFEEFGSNRLRIEGRIEDESKKRKKKAANEDIRRAREGAKAQEQIERDKAAIIGGFIGSLAGLVEQDSAEHKVLASAQALINTYLAATAALASGSEINPIFGIISAAAAIASGLASVAKINGVEFAEGGWTGPGHKMQAVGVVHADEYVVPKRIVNNPMARSSIANLESMRLKPYADGGLVSNSIAQPVNQQMDIANILKNMPPQVVSVKEVTKIQNRIQAKETLSKR